MELKNNSVYENEYGILGNKKAGYIVRDVDSNIPHKLFSELLSDFFLIFCIFYVLCTLKIIVDP